MQGAGALLQRWNDPTRQAYTLAVVNRLYAEREYRLRAEYVAATRGLFGAEVARLDFSYDPEESRGVINAWVEEQTRRRIRELLPSGSIHQRTRAVVVNAVYFYGKWDPPFDPAQTKDRVFYVGGEDEADVPMMRRYGGLYGRADGVQLAELPYAGGELSMLIALPDRIDGLPEVERRLDAALVAEWRSRVGEAVELELFLPRFRIESDAIALKPVLRALGIELALSDAADFSGITEPGQDPLKIDEAYHKTFVEVDEKGTEAAAATAFAMGIIESMDETQPPVFRADHPFLFFIVERATGTILFAGRVVDPRR